MESEKGAVQRGGAGRGQGRKPSGTPASKTYTMRLTPAHADKLRTLGGTDWIREQIEKTLAPPPPPAPAKEYPAAPAPAPSATPPEAEAGAGGEPRSFKTLDGATIYEPRKLELDGTYNIDHILDNL